MVTPVRIVTDSTCDLPADIIKSYDIWVLPLYINVGKQGFLDGIDISRQQFYAQLPSFTVHPTTAAPSPEKFRALYNALADEGASEVLSIHISASMSAVVDVANLAAQTTTSVPVTVLDSGQLSLGTGFLVETAAQLASQGLSIAEMMPVLQAQIKRTYVFAALDTMEFLKRSGRVNSVIARLGSFLQIKPIMKMHDGTPSAERVRTSSHATRRLVQLLAQYMPVERLAFVHTHALERLEALSRSASHLLPSTQILSVDITPVIGAHIGPGAVGFALITAA
jgi:DegV family protein with EDD domain